MAAKRGKKKSGRKANKTRIIKLSPDQKAARDEGPRLIPLRSPQHPPKVDHWVELGEKALAPASKKKGPGQ